MKRFLLAVAVATSLLAWSTPVRAHDAYDDSQSNPIRILAYAMNPIGFGLEWMVMRPIHFVVSQPRLERVFGHTPHENPFGGYEPYDADRR